MNKAQCFLQMDWVRTQRYRNSPSVSLALRFRYGWDLRVVAWHQISFPSPNPPFKWKLGVPALKTSSQKLVRQAKRNPHTQNCVYTHESCLLLSLACLLKPLRPEVFTGQREKAGFPWHPRWALLLLADDLPCTGVPGPEKQWLLRLLWQCGLREAICGELIGSAAGTTLGSTAGLCWAL